MTSAATKLPKTAAGAIYPLESRYSVEASNDTAVNTASARPNLSLVSSPDIIADEAVERELQCRRESANEFQGRFAHSDIITGAEYLVPSLRPIIRDENLNSNQRMELINVAQVTLRTIEYFLEDHPDPLAAPAEKVAELNSYLDRGMSLPYAGRIDTVGENRLVPQPDVVFPPAQPGAYRFQGSVLMIKNTMGGYVPLTLLIECM